MTAIQEAHTGDFVPMVLGRKARERIQAVHGNLAALVMQALADRADHEEDSPRFLEVHGYGVAGLAKQHGKKPQTIIDTVRILEEDGYIAVINRHRPGQTQAYRLNHGRIACAVEEWNDLNAKRKEAAPKEPLTADVYAVMARYMAIRAGNAKVETQEREAAKLVRAHGLQNVLDVLEAQHAKGVEITGLGFLRIPLKELQRSQEQEARRTDKNAEQRCQLATHEDGRSSDDAPPTYTPATAEEIDF